MNKNVFVIIATFNGEKWLNDLLIGLKASNYPVSILAIDNNSSDQSVKILKSFPEVLLIESKQNLGFGKANNLGIKKALELQADYLFLLNQDTIIYPDTIGNLLTVIESNRDFGILSPLHFSGSEHILDENFKTYWEGGKRVISDQLDEVSFVNAAAWFIPEYVVKKVGYFEPLFMHYGEDRNYVNRLRFHNFKIGIVKQAKIIHDRTIVRNLKKDIVQSRYLILNEVLNINNSLFVSYNKGFIYVLGLPKYFAKYYSLAQIFKLFYSLLVYFLMLKVSVFKILKLRSNYIK